MSCWPCGRGRGVRRATIWAAQALRPRRGAGAFGVAYRDHTDAFLFVERSELPAAHCLWRCRFRPPAAPPQLPANSSFFNRMARASRWWRTAAIPGDSRSPRIGPRTTHLNPVVPIKSAGVFCAR